MIGEKTDGMCAAGPHDYMYLRTHECIDLESTIN
jgi:hypothetical protein